MPFSSHIPVPTTRKRWKSRRNCGLADQYTSSPYRHPATCPVINAGCGGEDGLSSGVYRFQTSKHRLTGRDSSMNYVSTRGATQGDTFAYRPPVWSGAGRWTVVPDALKGFSKSEVDSYRDASYADVAKRIIGHFAGDSLPEKLISDSVDRALSAFSSLCHSAASPAQREYLATGTVPRPDFRLQGLRPANRRRADRSPVVRRKPPRNHTLCNLGRYRCRCAAAFAGRASVDVVVLHNRSGAYRMSSDVR